MLFILQSIPIVLMNVAAWIEAIVIMTSRKKSKSVLEMPVTPLLTAPPDNPFEEDAASAAGDVTVREDNQEEGPPATPIYLGPAEEEDGRRKKRFACAGETWAITYLT